MNFTFFKWNIRESFYLKFNNTDTLYSINGYPFDKSVSYTILNSEERQTILNNLDTLTFPKSKISSTNSNFEDGVTYAFYYKNNKETKLINIKGLDNVKQFWLFGDILNNIKNNHKFIPSDKKFDLNNMDKILGAPPIPPIIK